MSCNLTAWDCPFLRKKPTHFPYVLGVPGRKVARASLMLVQHLTWGPALHLSWGHQQGTALHLRQLCLSCCLLLPKLVARCPAALCGCPLPSAIPGHLCPRGRLPLCPTAPLTQPVPPAAPQPPASGGDRGGMRGLLACKQGYEPGDAAATVAASTGSGYTSSSTSVEEREGPGLAPGCDASAGRGGQGGTLSCGYEWKWLSSAETLSFPHCAGRLVPAISQAELWQGLLGPTGCRASPILPVVPVCLSLLSQQGGRGAAESLWGIFFNQNYFVVFWSRLVFCWMRELSWPAGWAGSRGRGRSCGGEPGGGPSHRSAPMAALPVGVFATPFLCEFHKLPSEKHHVSSLVLRTLGTSKPSGKEMSQKYFHYFTYTWFLLLSLYL